MQAKQRPQKDTPGAGFGIRRVYLYTFKRLYSMEASLDLGTPVIGSSAACKASSLRSASFVVTKIGAVPLYW